MGLINRLIDKRIAAYQNELMETHYAEVANMYHRMRGWRHDYRNHIQTMKSYAADGDLPALRRYLDELDADLSAVDVQVKTGNRMADAILRSKLSLAASRDIPVTIDANIPAELTTSQVDLCVIVGNLFDNAIEASMKLPQEARMIRIYMEMKNTRLYMSFTNLTATGKQARLGSRFASLKGQGHGFGLQRVDAAVERLGGYITRNSEDGAFTTEVLLPQ